MSGARNAFPWAQVMQLGLGQLRLAPEQFWRSTLRELSASRGAVPPQPLLRQTLQSLMELFPDE